MGNFICLICICIMVRIKQHGSLPMTSMSMKLKIPTTTRNRTQWACLIAVYTWVHFITLPGLRKHQSLFLHLWSFSNISYHPGWARHFPILLMHDLSYLVTLFLCHHHDGSTWGWRYMMESIGNLFLCPSSWWQYMAMEVHGEAWKAKHIKYICDGSTWEVLK